MDKIRSPAFLTGSALFLIEAGLQVSGINNLALAIALWSIAGILLLYWVAQFEWAIKLQEQLRILAKGRLVRKAVGTILTILLFLGGVGFQRWLSPPGITVNGTKVNVGPRKHTAVEAAPIPTSVRILFGPASIPPKEMLSKNVEWKAIEGTGYQRKYVGMSADPDETKCMFSMSDKCFSEYKYLDLVLSFQKPITFKNIKVTVVQGDAAPKLEQIIMTETDAVLRFSFYPTDRLLDIEATD